VRGCGYNSIDAMLVGSDKVGQGLDLDVKAAQLGAPAGCRTISSSVKSATDCSMNFSVLSKVLVSSSIILLPLAPAHDWRISRGGGGIEN
jgi:hypothetical protein